MPSVAPCPLPPQALLAVYARDGAYTDCFETWFADEVSLAQFVAAFYTTPLFRLERWILQWAVNKPSSDTEARQLAEGLAENFAAWRVEARADNQILLTDYRGRTRSWLMVAPAGVRAAAATRLYFGSAVVPGKTGAGAGYRILMRLHRLYSVLLLASASASLARRYRRP